MIVTRSRTLTADPEAVWKVLADPRSLVRWWPRVERVKAITAEGWTTVLRSERGRALRADWRLDGQEAGGAPGVGAVGRGHPVRQGAGRAPGRGPARARRRRHARDGRAAPARARDGPLRALHAPARGAQGARLGARRARGDGSGEARAGLLGLGRAGRRAVAARPRARLPARRSGRRRRRGRPAGEPRRGAAPAAGAAARAAVADRGEVRDDREARVLRCRGKSYLDLLAQRAGDCEEAPDAVVAPADADQVLAVLQLCAEEGVAVVPFGGGTSVVGGLEPLRGRFEALDLARPGPHGRPARRGRALADGGPRARHAAARGRPGAGRARAHPRPRAAELRVGDGRRLRRDALGGPGLDRPRPDRREPARRPLRDAARRAGDAGRPGDGGGTGAAPARRGLRGRARRHHRGHAAGASRPRGAALRGLAAARLRDRLRRAATARAGGPGAGRRASVGLRRDAVHARARRLGRQDAAGAWASAAC